MKNQYTLRAEDGKPAWGGLFWAVPMAYIFVDPYARQAAIGEWLLTALAFLVFLALYATGLIFWRRKDVLRKVCGAVTLLALAFTLYRPAGALFFPIVAAFIPFSVRGRVTSSAILLALLTITFLTAWSVAGRELDRFFFVIAFLVLLLGAGTTVIARQMLANDRLLRAAERERIARDLHDVLGHSLSAIILKAEVARRTLDENPRRAQIEIGEIERLSRLLLEDVRQAVRGYYGCNVQAELERAKLLLEAAGIEAQADCEEVELSPAQERVLALVLREAVTNVVRHAQATACRIELRRTRDACRLELHDNGLGGIHREGMGMRNIQQRVRSLGGSVSWNGDDGTALTVLLPNQQ